jgi:predicted TPR repeat methyltransferase
MCEQARTKEEYDQLVNEEKELIDEYKKQNPVDIK